MTQPRCILPESTYLITRRTLRRHHLLKPEPAVVNLITYALAVCAARYDVRVHAFVIMSTHLHLVVTDVRGRLPLFLGQFHRIVALAIKQLRAWEGPVWDHEQTSVVRLETPQAVVDKIAYVLANPVAAGLVYDCRDWPGIVMGAGDLGRRSLRAKRPRWFFDPANPAWPDTADLKLESRGEAHHDSSADVVEVLAEHLRRARAELRASGRKFAGAKRSLARSPYERSVSTEPLRALNPTFAVGRMRAAAVAAARRLRSFRSAYRSALRAWRTGERTVRFPPGTWLMAQLHAVVVAASSCGS